MEASSWAISMWTIWFIIAIILLIVEFVAPGIMAIFFALGGILAGLVSMVTDNFNIQLAVFAFSSLFLLVIGKRFLERTFKIHREAKASTIDAMKGKVGIVTKPVRFAEKGLVKINGEEWTAKTNDNIELLEGEMVEITGIEGVTVIIKKFKGEVE